MGNTTAPAVHLFENANWWHGKVCKEVGITAREDDNVDQVFEPTIAKAVKGMREELYCIFRCLIKFLLD